MNDVTSIVAIGFLMAMFGSWTLAAWWVHGRRSR